MLFHLDPSFMPYEIPRPHELPAIKTVTLFVKKLLNFNFSHFCFTSVHRYFIKVPSVQLWFIQHVVTDPEPSLFRRFVNIFTPREQRPTTAGSAKPVGAKPGRLYLPLQDSFGSDGEMHVSPCEEMTEDWWVDRLIHSPHLVAIGLSVG